MKLELTSPFDMHLHLREDEMLANVAPYSSAHFAGAVIMPNLASPVDSLEKVIAYREQIVELTDGDNFTPFMTLFFKNYTREELKAAKDHIIGIKLYPAGITTKSEKGVRDFSGTDATLRAMEELQIPLLIHGESNGFVMDREREFLPICQSIAEKFPRLHIVLEHITTADAVEFIDKYDNLSATVTLHHLLITLDDVAGGLLQPDLFCKPLAKTPRDRAALRDAVFSAHPKLMFGSDSAPHPRSKKECCGCAAGVFSAPVALPMLAELFENEGKLELLQGFIADIACDRYQLAPQSKKIIMEQKEWIVPELYNDVKPFGAGRKLRWKVSEITG
ncbi:MAG: dihydroorotase [Desulfobacterales bacterium]|nr:MAG: dihydroorotase [Desulfobacterales bacterium]